MKGRFNVRYRSVWSAWLTIGLITTGWFGCENPDDPTHLVGGDSLSNNSPNLPGTQPPVNQARDLWKILEPELVDACIGCHDFAGLANTPFLAGPDRYQRFVSWPGIIASNPENSLLLSYALIGKGHSGTNLDSSELKDTVLPKVKAWLAEEAKNFTAPPAEVGPHIDPFVPIMGFNAVYLDPLGPEFKGAAITFRAELLDKTVISFSNIEVQPTGTSGLHIVHPLFIVHPLAKPAVPDPTDSFSNFDQTFEAGKGGPLGPGTLVLVNWSTDAKLSFAFEKIEKLAPPPVLMGGCKDVPSFEQYASAAFLKCLDCHDGTDDKAQAAVDMSALGIDNALACGQIRNRVNPLDPPSSQVFVTTDPSPNGSAAHPYKFDGKLGNFEMFKNAVSVWIAAENK